MAYFVTRCEEAWTTSFSKGKNKNITFMAHLWEPLRVHHKPLVVHLFSEVAGAANRIWLLMLGFRLQRHKVCQDRKQLTVFFKLWQSFTSVTPVFTSSIRRGCIYSYIGCTRQHPTSNLSACCGRGECTGPGHRSVAPER